MAVRLHSYLRQTTIPVLLLLVFLLLSSGAVIYTTAQNVRSVKSLALQSLGVTAFSLSSSVEGLFQKPGGTSGGALGEVLGDRVVAYALIAGRDGVVQFHTNPGLIGSRLDEPLLDEWFMSEKTVGRMVMLQTGQSAYEYNHLFPGHDGSPRLLRLVLHTATAEQIVAKAQRMWWAVGIILFCLWGLAGLVWNIFHRYLRIQEDFQRRENVAMIGQMTGVLAHEIRNALAGVRGYTQWVEEKTSEDDPRKAGLAMALKGTERIESLINDLLLFSREEKYDIETVEPTGLIKMILKSISPSWGGTMKVDAGPGILVKADREKLHRVVLNGVQNAIQAMGSEGSLHVVVRNRGPWAEIEMRDTGPGIDDVQMPHLFTPFYTTKTNGTGLGLAYSRKVVEGMGGRINLFNRQDGPGAVLTIRLLKAEE